MQARERAAAPLQAGAIALMAWAASTAPVLALGSSPDPIRFADVADAYPRLAVISNAASISGLSGAVPVTVAGGAYSINGLPFTEQPGTASNGDSIRLYVLPGPMLNDVAQAVLSVGDSVSTFSVTTQVPTDTHPDPIQFDPITAAPLGSTVTSGPLTVRGINAPAAIAVSGGTYSINGGPFTNANGQVVYGDVVRLQTGTGTSYSIDSPVTLTIDTVSTAWSVRTVPKPTRPDPFTLSLASMYPRGLLLPASTQTTNAVVVSNVSGTAAVTVTGGQYSINGGPYTAASGKVKNGDRVTVQFVTSSAYSESTSVTLKIGSVKSTLKVKTTVDPVAKTPTTVEGASADFVFRDSLPVPLRVFAYYPAGWKASDRRAAYINWFGGGWLTGVPVSGESRYWVSNEGMVGFEPDYRVNDRFGDYAYRAADDARALVKWVEDNAAMLGVDPARIVVSGASAGAGNALWAALRDAPPSTDPASSPPIRPAAVVLRSGVVDGNGHGEYVDQGFERFGPYGPTIGGGHYPDPAMPPVIAGSGDADDIAAQSNTVDFCSALLRLGAVCEFQNQAGLGHKWTTDKAANSAFRSAQRQFLYRIGVLPAVRR